VATPGPTRLKSQGLEMRDQKAYGPKSLLGAASSVRLCLKTRRKFLRFELRGGSPRQVRRGRPHHHHVRGRLVSHRQEVRVVLKAARQPMLRFARATALVVLCCAACHRPPRHEPPSARSAPSPHASSLAPEPAQNLCAGRPRCRLERQRSSPSPSKLQVVDVRIEHAADAAEGDDEAHCDRREYWLIGPPGPLLLAADCEAQWGPDCAAPADTRLDGEQLVVSYEERAASDVCETLKATLSLTARSVTRQDRRRGTYEKRQCRRQAAIQPLPLGDGSAERPLLTLHQ